MALSNNKTKIFAIIIVIVVTIITVCLFLYLKYRYTGWKEFTIKKGENFQLINDDDPTLVSKIDFTECIVTIKSNTNEVKTQDVSKVLQNMVAAYKNNTNKNYVFKLDDPGLSVYSFQIPNFNDSKNKPKEEIWGDNSPGTDIVLHGYYKLI